MHDLIGKTCFHHCCFFSSDSNLGGIESVVGKKLDTYFNIIPPMREFWGEARVDLSIFYWDWNETILSGFSTKAGHTKWKWKEIDVNREDNYLFLWHRWSSGESLWWHDTDSLLWMKINKLINQYTRFFEDCLSICIKISRWCNFVVWNVRFYG